MSSSHLPGEIIDYIVDFLHNEPRTLEQCCLVSKPWLPRAQNYLFNEIHFESPNRVDTWKATFPNPANSPGRYTRSLRVQCVWTTSVMVAVQSISILAFPNVVRLELWTVLCKFSISQYLEIICSFPRLEDLDISCSNATEDYHDDTSFRPSTSPPLTGTLRLRSGGGVGFNLGRLLELPNSIRFRKCVCKWYNPDDVLWIRALVDGCSDTLQFIVIEPMDDDELGPADIDLSKATRLKKVKIRLRNLDDVPTAMALKTLTSNHRDLQKISLLIRVPSPLNALADIERIVGGETRRLWMEFDNILTRLGESRAIQISARVVYSIPEEKEVVRKIVWSLLPVALERGIVELVVRSSCY